MLFVTPHQQHAECETLISFRASACVTQLKQGSEKGATSMHSGRRNPNGLTPHLPVLQHRVGLGQHSRAQAIILEGRLDQTLLVIRKHLKHIKQYLYLRIFR